MIGVPLIYDMIVISNSWEDHLVHINKVVEALKKVGMTANPKKCVWGAETLVYLGHEVRGEVVKVPEARVTAIKNYKKPVTKTLRAFGDGWQLSHIYPRLCK